MMTERTPPKKKAQELAKYLRAERPDYSYLKSVFRALRQELEIQIPKRRGRATTLGSDRGGNASLLSNCLEL